MRPYFSDFQLWSSRVYNSKEAFTCVSHLNRHLPRHASNEDIEKVKCNVTATTKIPTTMGYEPMNRPIQRPSSMGEAGGTSMV